MAPVDFFDVKFDGFYQIVPKALRLQTKLIPHFKALICSYLARIPGKKLIFLIEILLREDSATISFSVFCTSYLLVRAVWSTRALKTLFPLFWLFCKSFGGKSPILFYVQKL